MQKKKKKLATFEKIFFPQNDLNALKFVRNTRINFRPVSLKKEGSHFSRNLCPGYAINFKKIVNVPKNFFPLKQLIL